MSFVISRRRLLATAAAAPLGGVVAGLAPSRAWGRSAPAPRILVLVELNGGNDGLNTVVPYADPAYAAARPQLAVPRERVLQLDEGLGLHPSLAPLRPLWDSRELSLALGVGYERPNRSHFRSIEIWNSGSTAAETLQEGWLSRVLTETGGREGSPAQGIVLGGPEGPLAGPGLTSVVLRDPRRLRQAAALLDGKPAAPANPALAHILAERQRMQSAAEAIARRLAEAPPLRTTFPETALGRQLQRSARLIAAGAPASVYKLRHSGYDTHAGQAARHARLLDELAEGLAAFRAAMVEWGIWERTLVMTYAEFGRRVAENASGGSDHGSAAPHFLLGGRLRGGFLGAQPALDDLEGGDLKPRLDFRRLYAAVAGDWLGLPPAPDSLGRHRPLALLA